MFTDTNNRHTRRFHRRISNHIHISIYKREGSQHKLRGLGILNAGARSKRNTSKKRKSSRSAGCQRQTESIWEMFEFEIIFVLA